MAVTRIATNPRKHPNGVVEVDVMVDGVQTTIPTSITDGPTADLWAQVPPLDQVPMAPDYEEVITARRVQVELWLDANGFPNGFKNPTVAALAAAAGSEAEIRLRSGEDFKSNDPLLVALTPALGITDLRAALIAARLL